MPEEQNPQPPGATAAVMPAVERSVCHNCGAVLSGKYCSACGQKEVDLNPTIGALLHEVWHELLHVDGKLIPSMRLLLNSPGALTLEHYAGHRARYISPMRLYLVFSVLYFAVAAVTPGSSFKVTVGAKPVSGWSTETHRQSDPEELRKLGFESQEQLQEATNHAIVHWLPRMMFLLVPLFAVPDNGAAADFMKGQLQGRPPSGGNGYHAISRDGLNFKRVANIRLPDTHNRWLGGMLSVDSRLYYFGTGPGPWPVTSTDGINWQTPASVVIVPGADPGAVRLNDGSWLFLVTGPPRQGTSSARIRIPNW